VYSERLKTGHLNTETISILEKNDGRIWQFITGHHRPFNFKSGHRAMSPK
jgi:hypothetical protein